VKSGCRVVANPLGYARNGEQEGFKPRPADRGALKPRRGAMHAR
jgi:hypothetical protein